MGFQITRSSTARSSMMQLGICISAMSKVIWRTTSTQNSNSLKLYIYIDCFETKTQYDYFERRSLSRDPFSRSRKNFKLSMLMAGETRYTNNLESKPMLGKNGVKVYNKNLSIGIRKVNSNKRLLRETNRKLDSFNSTILDYEHDVSAEANNYYGDPKIPFKPMRNISVRNSHNSMFVPSQ